MGRTAILIAAVLFGTTGTAQALGPAVEPLAVGSARIVAGALLLFAIALVAGRLTPRGRPALVLAAGACVAVYQASFFVAAADTGVAVSAVVALGSAPAFTGVVAYAFTGERPGRSWALATTLACGGVALMVLAGGSAGSEVSAPGVGLALISGAGYAGYAVASKAMLEAGAPPEGLMAWVFGTGALLLLPVLVLTPGGELSSPGGIALIAYLAAVPTALAYVLFARGLERTGASETATLTLAEPLTATLLGVLVLGERPGAAAAAGAALVLAGLALLALRPAPAGRAAGAPA